jgi:hypothetical protein
LASESLPATGPLGVSPKEGGSDVHNRIKCEPASSQQQPALRRRNAPLSRARRADDWPTSRGCRSHRNDEAVAAMGVTLSSFQVGFESALLIALSLTFGVFAIAGAWVVAFAMAGQVTTESKLLRDALTDALTAWDNRRSLNAALDSEWNRARRSGRALSMLFIDIDYFKRFNDALGHEVGDGVLMLVAESIRASVGRSSDLVARYGGEEFAVLLPDTTARARMYWLKLYVNGYRPCN